MSQLLGTRIARPSSSPECNVRKQEVSNYLRCMGAFGAISVPKHWSGYISLIVPNVHGILRPSQLQQSGSHGGCANNLVALSHSLNTVPRPHGHAQRPGKVHIMRSPGCLKYLQ